MPQYDINKATTTEISVPDFIVKSKSLDVDNADGDTIYYFEEAAQKIGYYSEIAEINSGANSLATWAFGKGWTSENSKTVVELKHFTGRGNDTYATIMWNVEVMKLIVGDGFAEIIRKGNVIVNMIPVSPERVRIISNSGRIKRYEIWNGKSWKKVKVRDMYHTSNKRIGDQIHGTSQIDAVKWVIDARNEALITNRMIEKRGRALGIVYYKTNNEGKIAYANEQIEKAVKEGQMVGLPEGTAEIKEFPSKPLSERMEWIRYLENFFYQVFGVPRSLVTSDGTSEVGGIGGHIIFEQIYGKEQLDEEQNTWNQMARRVKWNRPPSLAPQTQENQDKNTGTTKIQEGEVEPKLNR